MQNSSRLHLQEEESGGKGGEDNSHARPGNSGRAVGQISGAFDASGTRGRGDSAGRAGWVGGAGTITVVRRVVQSDLSDFLRDDRRVTTKAGIDLSVAVDRIGVCGEESTGIENILHEAFLGPLGDTSQIEVCSPLGGGVGVLGGVVNVGAHLSEVGVSVSQGLHHRTDGRGTGKGIGRVNDTEHSFVAMVGNGTVEEGGVGIVDDLLKDEVLQLDTRGEGGVGSLVARSELRTLGNGMVIGTPDEFDGIADGSVDGKRNVTEDTLGRSDPDDVSLAGGRVTGRRVAGGGHRGVAGLALLNAVIVGVAPP